MASEKGHSDVVRLATTYYYCDCLLLTTYYYCLLLLLTTYYYTYLLLLLLHTPTSSGSFWIYCTTALLSTTYATYLLLPTYYSLLPYHSTLTGSFWIMALPLIGPIGLSGP